MDVKLTLKLDKQIIEDAKVHAERRGVSLSSMVERYFRGLTEAEKPADEPRGVVAELAGLLKGQDLEDPREGYTEYLIRKYS